MHKIHTYFIILAQLFCGTALAISCVDSRDTYADYDNDISQRDVNNVRSEYYVLSYSWAPRHCVRVKQKSKKPGNKNYLQCGSGVEVGYILHGLWPQGALDKSGGYPRACEGDQEKINREILEQFLCMTPSVWLLQHEYEFHGTCMHDESLEDPINYFTQALQLHSQLTLPKEKLKYNEDSIQWFIDNNTHVARKSIQYYRKGEEWQFCYDNNFNLMSCPNEVGNSSVNLSSDCRIKGNISSNSGKKYYFTTSHPNYPAVVITPSKGERCFASEHEAIEAGWFKAP